MPDLFIKNYREALIKNGQISLPGFENGVLRVIKNGKKEPLCWFGSSAVVFKLTDGERNFALKCFITEIYGRWSFLEKVKQKLDEINNDRIVSFEIFKDALVVEDDQKNVHKCSVILMPWIEGCSLRERVSLYCLNNHVAGIRRLCSSFIDLAVGQLGQPYSHGDINPANIMVKDDDKMIFIDHDSFGFVDTINEFGAADWTLGYQHPYRHPNYVDLHVDDFPFLLISISLKALEHNPDLYHRFGTSKGLLFSVDDLKRPWDSKIIAELEKTDDPYLKRLLHVLQLSLINPNIEIPGLLQYLTGDLSAEQENELAEAVQNQIEKTEHRIYYIPEEQRVSNPLPVVEDSLVSSPDEPAEKSSVTGTTPFHQKRRNRTRLAVFTALLTITAIVIGIKYYLPGNALVMPMNYNEFTKSQRAEKTDLSNSGKEDFTKELNKAHLSIHIDSNSVYADNTLIADTRNSVEKLKNNLFNETEEKANASFTGSEKKPENVLKTAEVRPGKKTNAVKPKRGYDVEFRKIEY
jgi:serine/threonine protein kinase